MKARGFSVFLALLVVGLSLVFGTEPFYVARAAGIDGTELGRLYSEFEGSWDYVPDGEVDLWSVSPEHQGDCEDFALTFYVEYPRPVAGWILIVNTRSSFLERLLGASSKTSSHALLVLWEQDGFYVVDNGNVVGLEGPFSSYEETVTFYVEASRAVSAWDFLLPSSTEVASGIEGLRDLYLVSRHQVFP